MHDNHALSIWHQYEDGFKRHDMESHTRKDPACDDQIVVKDWKGSSSTMFQTMEQLKCAR